MPSKADVKAWKAQLVAQAEQKILKLTDSDRFKQYLNTLAKFHQYSARNIDLIYAQNPQTSGDPVLSAKDFVKENLTDHQNVTSLYNAFKDYLNQQTDLQVSEAPLAKLNGAKGYFQPSTNKIVIGGDEPDNALKLKTLYHEYAHSQLHGLKAAFKDRPRAYQETQAEAVAYVAMQNIGVDTSNYSLGYVATWAKDKAVIHSALSEIQQVSNKVIALSDGLTKQLGLQEAQKDPEHDLKKRSAKELNQSYQGLQQQIQQATDPQRKSEIKNQLNDVYQEISNRTQKQLKAFTEQNTEVKQQKSKKSQGMSR